MPGKLLKAVRFPGDKRFEVVVYDLLFENTDCIVNAANGGLSHGGGVAAAISKAAGPKLDEEGDRLVREQGRVPVGEAVVTTAGDLPFKGVIHAVGPRMGEGDEDEKLERATLSSLKLADKHGLLSIAFPAISTGIFGFPIDRCASVMLSAVIEYAKGATKLERIVFCLYGKEAFKIFNASFTELLQKAGAVDI